LHSSGIVKDHKAYVFFGPSGAGKTTVAHLSEGYPLLSDDQVLIYLKEGRPFASGVPFSGGERFRQENNAIPSLNVNQEFEIAGFYYLVKDEKNFLEPLSLVMGAARLASTIPFIKDGPFPMQKALDIATEIAKVSKIYSLHFKKDRSFWDIL
jgi:ABC-type multidrug transport system ATPase subunit